MRWNFARCVLALLLAAPAISFASTANPTGNFGDKNQWDPKWSDAFFKCWDKYAEKDAGSQGGPIESAFRAGLSDTGSGKPWCPVSGALDQTYQIKLFMLANLKNLCKFESGCNPSRVNPKGKNEPAIGLFQIGVNDSTNNHHCQGPNGEGITSVGTLQEPENNICCAVKIATDVAKQNAKPGRGANSFSDGKTGIMSAFWEPYRTKKDEIEKAVNQDCKALASGGYSGGGDLTAKEFETAQNGRTKIEANSSGGTR